MARMRGQTASSRKALDLTQKKLLSALWHATQGKRVKACSKPANARSTIPTSAVAASSFRVCMPAQELSASFLLVQRPTSSCLCNCYKTFRLSGIDMPLLQMLHLQKSMSVTMQPGSHALLFAHTSCQA